MLSPILLKDSSDITMSTGTADCMIPATLKSCSICERASWDDSRAKSASLIVDSEVTTPSIALSLKLMVCSSLFWIAPKVPRTPATRSMTASILPSASGIHSVWPR